MNFEEAIEKRKSYARAYYERNKERIKANVRKAKLANPELYKKLNREWKARRQARDPESLRVVNRRSRARHAKYRQEKTWQWAQKKPGIYLLYNAKQRAKKLGLPFNLTYADIVIPTHCPVLGIPIEVRERPQRKGFHPNSPSIDRIICGLGYVRGNVRVISMRANDLKRNATPEELRKVAMYAHRETERVKRELLGNGPP